jgi:hypothetical protein
MRAAWRASGSARRRPWDTEEPPTSLRPRTSAPRGAAARIDALGPRGRIAGRPPRSKREAGWSGKTGSSDGRPWRRAAIRPAPSHGAGIVSYMMFSR